MEDGGSGGDGTRYRRSGIMHRGELLEVEIALPTDPSTFSSDCASRKRMRPSRTGLSIQFASLSRSESFGTSKGFNGCGSVTGSGSFRSSADAVNSDGGAGSIDYAPLQPTQAKHSRRQHRITKNILPRDTENSQPTTSCIRCLLAKPLPKIRLV